jgi:hypothetical protein
MSQLSGPFWDAVEGRAPMPRAAATRGMQFIDADVKRRTIELGFEGTEDFTNPTGNVLGAFVAAMLYDTVGPALLATPQPDQFQSTLGLSVSSCGRSGRAGSSAGAALSAETDTWPSWRPRPGSGRGLTWQRAEKRGGGWGAGRPDDKHFVAAGAGERDMERSGLEPPTFLGAREALLLLG